MYLMKYIKILLYIIGIFSNLNDTAYFYRGVILETDNALNKVTINNCTFKDINIKGDPTLFYSELSKIMYDIRIINKV